jgi:hypothetical protein
MHYSYTGGRHNNMLFHLVPPKKMFYSYIGSRHQKCPIGYPSNKCSKYLLLSLRSFVAKKETRGYAKVIHKKKKN